jgi:hypothetical protein
MQKSYGVVWHEGDLTAHGKLEFLPRGLLFDGISGSVLTHKNLAYSDLVRVTKGRGAQDRIKDLPTMILQPREGLPITVTTVAQASLISEVAERLATAWSDQLAGSPSNRDLCEGLSPASTPGPGDSDGGDVFPP